MILRKLPIIGVFGQGTPISDDHARLARDAGTLIALLGAHLLTGGGYGVMEAAAQGFVAVSDRAGLSIGIVPRDPHGPFDLPTENSLGRRYPNAFVEIAIMTPLPPMVTDWRTMPGRNVINVLTVDAAVAVPGNEGTSNELDMAAEYLGEAARPKEQRRTVLFGPADRFTPRHLKLFVHAATLAEVEAHVVRTLSARGFELGQKL